MNKLNLTKSLVLVAALSLGACGKSLKRQSDPLGDFPELRQDVPKSQYKPSDQNYVGPMFALAVEGRDDSALLLDFEQGRSTTHKLVLRSLVEGASFKLAARNLPQGATLKPNGELKWTPPAGTIPQGASRQTVTAEVEVTLDHNTNARVRDMFEANSINRIRKITLQVFFAQVQPKVSKVIGLDKGEYALGEVIRFRVEVTDPESNKDKKPKVYPGYEAELYTAEAPRFSLLPAILVDYDKKDQFMGNGRWAFHFILDTTIIEKYVKNLATFTGGGEFVMYAFNSESSLAAPVYPVRLKFSKREVVTPAAPKGAPAPKPKATATPPPAVADQEKP